MQKRPTTYNPYEHADQAGAHIIYADPGPGRLGLTEGHTITLKPGQSTRQERCTLAHEIVHYEYGDGRVLDHVWHARREARCDRIAAERLIDPYAFRAAAAWSDDPGEWAIELGVTRRILEAYLKTRPWLGA